MKQKIRLTCALVFIFGAALVAFNYEKIFPWVGFFFQILADKEKTTALIESFGYFAPLAFIGVQVFQVVFAPIPGEATGFLGGYLFGVVPGFLYSTAGLTAGSYMAFQLARLLEESFVEAVVSKEVLKKFDFAAKENGVIISFLLFLIPGFPKDYLCFILGLSPMPLKIFLVITAIGRMPGTMILSLQGANVYSHDYTIFFILLGISILIGLLVIIYRDPIYEWLKQLGNDGGDRGRGRRKDG